MPNNKYKYIAAILLVLNLALMAFFFFSKPPHHKHGDLSPMERVKEQLSLDEDQFDLFIALVEKHQEKMRDNKRQQIELLGPLFVEIAKKDSTNLNPESLLKLQEIEGEKVKLTYEHFVEVKSILNKEQEKNFDEFMTSVLRTIFNERNKENQAPSKIK